MSRKVDEKIESLPVSLDRDAFLRTLLRELAGTLEQVVGMEDAQGFISVVGRTMGDHLNQDYKQALGTSSLDPEQIASVLVDLKRRIGGAFHIEDVTEQKIVLRNSCCPFGESVKGRRSLCMMTSNVFGSITADNLGYARVELRETIASGGRGCHVIVHLSPLDGGETDDTHEYFGGSDS